ncbi:MAG: cyclic nucleotide-binding domain-containing protein [Humidesulfovibrio sp.]
MPETAGAPQGAVFRCASCGHSQSLPDGLLGRQAKCPKCGQLGLVGRPQNPPQEPGVDDVRLDDLADADPSSALPRPAAPRPDQDSLALEATLKPEGALDHLRQFFSGNPALNFVVGLLGGIQESLACLALALLVFSVPTLSGAFPHALYLTLFPAVFGSVLFALHGRLPVAVGGPGPAATLCVLLLLTTVGLDLEGRASAQVIATTMLFALALASTLTGVVGVLSSRFALAERIRFLPVEIFGGMLAGFGLLLLKAWFLVLTAGVPELAGLFQLPAEDMGRTLMRHATAWGPPVAFGLLYFLVRTSIKGMLWPLLLALLAVAGWNAALMPGGPALAPWIAQLPRVPDLLNLKCYLTLFDASSLTQIDWAALSRQKEFFAAVAVATIAPTLVRTTILEAVLARDADPDAQLRMVSGASMLSGVLGGMPATLSLSSSLGLRALGATGPVAGFTVGLVCLAFALYGQALLPRIPLFVPLGILLATALSMPVNWLLRDSKNPLTRKDDQRMAWMACLLTVVLGPVLGVFSCLGLGLAAGLARAVHGGGVKLIQTGDVFHSNVDRSPAERRVLREHGGQILILRLHGFLFLGTLYGLLRTIRQRMEAAGPAGLRFVLLDFGAVSGLGASALHGFRRLEHLALERGMRLYFTSVPLEMEEHLEALGYSMSDMDGVCRIYLNMDYALESCEDLILAEAGGLEQRLEALEDILAATFPEPRLVPTLMKCLERMEVPKKKHVIRQGDESDSLYFLQSGKVQVELALPGGKLLRLKKMGPGTVFGEMGLYTSAPRSASVIATERCVVYQLSAERFKLIQDKAPQLASAVNRFIVTLLAERVAEENAKNRAAQL